MGLRHSPRPRLVAALNPSASRRARRAVLVPLLALAGLLAATPAWAYWATLGSGAGSARTATLSAPGPVTATAVGGGTVRLAWSAAALSTGTPVTGYYVTRNGSSSSVCGSASAPLSATGCDDTGLAPGTYGWTVTAVYRSWTSTAVSNQVTVVSGPAAGLSVVSGNGQSARVGTAFAAPLVAKVVDAGGNPVGGASVTFTATAGGASGAFPGALTATVATDGNGLATAPTFTANTTSGAYSVGATVSGTALSVAFQLSNTPGDASAVSVASGSPQTLTIGASASPLVARVVDAYGNAVPGVSVAFNAPAGGASGTFTGSTRTASATSDSNGLATAPAFTANTTVGSYSVTASITGSSVGFSLTNQVGAPSAVAVSGGSGQSVVVGGTFAAPLMAKVVDAGGNPLSGVTVTFTAPSPATGATATFLGADGKSTTAVATATTDASGVASAPALTANSYTGGYTVIASVAGVSSTASFSLTNLVGANPTITSVTPSALVRGDTDKTLVILGTNFRPGAKVTVSNTQAISVGTITFLSPTEIDVLVSVDINANLGNGNGNGNGSKSNITVTNLDGSAPATKGNAINLS